mmetsp:Transcript_19163/g.49482  ORF Transcript_19163/g.49482 Transcript_19163/m.49482 type:complete len:261 (+) Transcript_19163:124-906(+)
MDTLVTYGAMLCHDHDARGREGPIRTESPALLLASGRQLLLAHARLDVLRLLLGLVHNDLIRQRLLRASLASRVMRKHDGHADANHALAHRDVADGVVDVQFVRVAGADEVPIAKLHALGARAADLARDHHLRTLCAALHDEPHDAIRSTAHSKTADELIAQRLALRDSAEATVGDLLGVQLDGALGELPALLNEPRELTNAAALLAKHVLCARCTDDDLCAHRRHTHLDARVAILSELTRKHLVQLSVEHAIGDELALL